MRTHTVIEALVSTCYRIGSGDWISDAQAGKTMRQSIRFRNELIRRGDRYDNLRGGQPSRPEDRAVYYVEINPDGSVARLGALDPERNDGQQRDPEWFFIGPTFCVYLWAGSDAEANALACQLWRDREVTG
jgi:hypothetical protein